MRRRKKQKHPIKLGEYIIRQRGLNMHLMIKTVPCWKLGLRSVIIKKRSNLIGREFDGTRHLPDELNPDNEALTTK